MYTIVSELAITLVHKIILELFAVELIVIGLYYYCIQLLLTYIFACTGGLLKLFANICTPNSVREIRKKFHMQFIGISRYALENVLKNDESWMQLK